MKNERHPLYSAALKADERYDRTIETQFPGKTRWTLTKEESAHPEIELAYRAKVKADRAWLDYLRTANNTPEDRERDKCAEGVARALLREHLEQTEKTDRAIDDLEMRMKDLARRMGMPV